jgi:Ser/Thr protein kinase RdoA (MazF antagonist)
MRECHIGYGCGWDLALDQDPRPKESWVERQRRLWEEALDRLEKALGRRTPKEGKP